MCVLYPYVDNTVRIFIALLFNNLLLSIYIEQHFYFLHCVQNNSFSLTGWRTTYRMIVFLRMFVLFLIFHLLSSLNLFWGVLHHQLWKGLDCFLFKFLCADHLSKRDRRFPSDFKCPSADTSHHFQWTLLYFYIKLWFGFKIVAFSSPSVI